jgi:hypothetical protein
MFCNVCKYQSEYRSMFDPPSPAFLATTTVVENGTFLFSPTHKVPIWTRGLAVTSLTILREHGDHFEADVLLHAQPEVSEGGDDLGDLLHHVADVLAQLIHRDGPPHHGGETGLQRHQVRGHLAARWEINRCH